MPTGHIQNNLQTGFKQLHPGDVLLNRYSIQKIIGIGGMGAVYLSRDLHFPNAMKLVAVKEMISTSRDPKIQQTVVNNFEREANILGTLSHPSIPIIFDYFTEKERSYLILEYIEGRDLETILRDNQGPLPEKQIITWAIELCDVLSYLHNHEPEKIIFRDFKPSNVMINQQNHAVLIDFGIAKPFQAWQKQTMVGTEGYAPPEQYRGEVNEISDIYGLGATMHHLVTGRDPRLEPPFTFHERPIRSINPLISPELEQIVQTALQYEAENRYQTAEDMKKALMQTQAKNRFQPTKKNSKDNLTYAQKNILWTYTCEDEIRGSPSVENGYVYIGSYDKCLYAINAATGNLAWKYSTEGGIVCQPIIQDGIIYIGSEDRRVFAIIERTGRLTWTYPTDGPVRCTPTLAEGHLLVGSDDGFLHAVNLTSSRRVWCCEVGSPIRSRPVIAHDMICFGTERGEVFAVDFGGKIRWRFKSKKAVTGGLIFINGLVIFGSLDSSMYALNGEKGTLVWRYRMGKGSASTPCSIDNKIFIGSADNNLYCLDVNNGKEIWRYQTGHQVSGSPVIYRDQVICGSADGRLYFLDIRTGHLQSAYDTDGTITSAPAIVNDILYIGTHEKTIFAFQL